MLRSSNSFCVNTLRIASCLSIVFVFSIILSAVVFTPSLFAATTSSIRDGVNAAQGNGVPTDLFGDGGMLTTITNILLFIVGALSVIMIIIGGLRYVTSGGNSTSVTAAKNTILYAIVGLVVSFLAYAAINYVLGSLTGGTGGGTNI